MAYQPVPNTVSAELRFQYFGENVENTLHFHNDGGVTAGNMADLAEYLNNWWFETMRTIQSNSLVMREIYLTDLTTETGPTYTDTFHAGITGVASASPGLPGNVTVCASFRTVKRGRSGRGRNYFLGLTEAAVTGNDVGGATIGAVIDIYEELLTLPPTPYEWVVVSRYHEGAKRPIGLAEPVTAVLIVDNHVDSQRRRLATRGT